MPSLPRFLMYPYKIWAWATFRYQINRKNNKYEEIILCTTYSKISLFSYRFLHCFLILLRMLQCTIPFNSILISDLIWFRHETNPRSLQVLWDSPTLTLHGIDFLMPALCLIAQASTIKDPISWVLSLRWNCNSAGMCRLLGGIETKLGQFGSLD